jgi:LPXTG-site transpeptidase (sortase) family protein
VRGRAAAVAVGVVVAAAGCGTAPSVVVARPPAPAAEPVVSVPLGPEPSTTVEAAPRATPAPVPATAAPVPTIPSHAAHLDELPGPAAVVPVGVAAGDAIAGPVVPAGVDETTGELALPAEAKVVAWYQYGPAPGANGSAVLAGHVDWHGVPGIFFKLRELKTGDTVAVTMSDGSTQSWTVVDVHLVAKPQLPVADVFSRTGPPTLTLITCGGSFDWSTHHYLSNVVATAVPA